jgi:hypothetical protein
MVVGLPARFHFAERVSSGDGLAKRKYLEGQALIGSTPMAAQLL